MSGQMFQNLVYIIMMMKNVCVHYFGKELAAALFEKIHFSPNFYQCVQWAPPLAQPDPRTASALNISRASYSFTFNGFSRHRKLQSTRKVLSALKIMHRTKHFLFSVLFFMHKESLPHASYWSSSCSQKDSIYGHCTWTIMGRSLPLDV